MPDFSDAWYEGDDSARWRSAAVTGPGTGASSSGSSLLEVDPGHRLPRHTDSAEESIVLIQGEAEVTIGGESRSARAGDIVLVPECVPHEVRNAGSDVLCFAAVYAAPDVTTTYERPVQPDGEAERSSVA